MRHARLGELWGNSNPVWGAREGGSGSGHRGRGGSGTGHRGKGECVEKCTPDGLSSATPRRTHIRHTPRSTHLGIGYVCITERDNVQQQQQQQQPLWRRVRCSSSSNSGAVHAAYPDPGHDRCLPNWLENWAASCWAIPLNRMMHWAIPIRIDNAARVGGWQGEDWERDDSGQEKCTLAQLTRRKD